MYKKFLQTSMISITLSVIISIPQADCAQSTREEETIYLHDRQKFASQACIEWKSQGDNMGRLESTTMRLKNAIHARRVARFAGDEAQLYCALSRGDIRGLEYRAEGMELNAWKDLHELMLQVCKGPIIGYEMAGMVRLMLTAVTFVEGEPKLFDADMLYASTIMEGCLEVSFIEEDSKTRAEKWLNKTERRERLSTAATQLKLALLTEGQEELLGAYFKISKKNAVVLNLTNRNIDSVAIEHATNGKKTGEAWTRVRNLLVVASGGCRIPQELTRLVLERITSDVL